MKYYVYEWFVINTNEIFYVGKGCNNRYKVRKRNKIFNNYIDKYDCESRIIKYFENEEDAYKFEYYRIKELKEKGMCKANLHSGGAGGSGEYWTEELREEYSKNNVMKNPLQRKRMSINNPMKNKEVAAVVAAKKSRKVVINEIIYNSIKDAMQKYNVCYDTIKSWCNRGINYYNEKCRFFDEEQKEFTDNRYNKGCCKPLIYIDKQYESAVDLAKELNCSSSRIYSWVKRGFDPNGNICRYLDDTRDLNFENRYVNRNKNRSNGVIINGIKYDSVASASIVLNIPKSTLYSYLNGKRDNYNYICTYDNQQPSQENSD